MLHREKNLLQIVQDAATQVGIPRPTVVASSTTETPRRMLRLLNAAGKQLAQEAEWPHLITVESFNGSGVEEQGRPSTTSFNRLLSGGQIWNTSTKRPCIGPLSYNDYLGLKLNVVAGPDFYWSIGSDEIDNQGDHFLMWPVPSTSDLFTYVFSYQKWVSTPDGVTWKQEFSADDDVHHLDDELLTLELVWRWKQAVGLDYAEDMASASRYKEMTYAGMRMKADPNLSDPFDGMIPDGFWPGRITA